MINVNGITAEHLKSFIERLERLEEEKQAIADDIRGVLAEAKANGFDTKIIRKILKIRKADARELQEEDMILHTYMLALGMTGAE
jgi:uncharacterized protein (UPF0335 family)